MNKIYPFKFLDSYTKDDKDIFFGRDDETEQLFQMLTQSDIVLVYGASGTGKTSLIQCGLSKKIDDYDWMPFYIRRGANLNTSIKNTLQKNVPESKVSVRNFLDDLFEEEQTEQQSGSEVLQLLQKIYMSQFKPLYLIFDQFEELFILGNKDEQNEFLKIIKEILDAEQPIKLIFSIREEYLGHLYDFEKAVPELLRKKIRVEAMHREKVQEIVKGVTEYKQSNISIADNEIENFTLNVFEKIKGKKELTIQLPYLQVFLDKLYLNITNDKERQKDALFTISELEKLGNIDDVLSEFLEEQVQGIQQKLKNEHKNLEQKTLWEILSPYATLEGTKDPLTKQQLYDRLPQTNQQLIDKVIIELTNRSILRYIENEDVYELMHDALAHRVAEKRSEDEIALLQARQLIKNQISLKAEHRSFFNNKQLALIVPFTEKLNLTQEEKEFIEQSEKEAEKQRMARVYRQRKIIAGVTVAALISIALAIIAVIQLNRANDALKIAEEQTEIANESFVKIQKSFMKEAFLYMQSGEYEVAKQKFEYLRDSIPGGDTSSAVLKRINECDNLVMEKKSFDSLMTEAQNAIKIQKYIEAVDFYEKALKTKIEVGKEEVVIELQELKSTIDKKAGQLRANADFTDRLFEKNKWNAEANELEQLSQRINYLIK